LSHRLWITALCAALLTQPAAAQVELPADMRARAELAQTVAELVMKKGEYDRVTAAFIQRGATEGFARASAEWDLARDRVGSFLLGYIVGSLDAGQPAVRRPCGNVNSYALGEAAVDRLAAAEAYWREKWVDVLIRWLRAGTLLDPPFLSRVCSQPT
jgi:hypothetical protein